MKIHNTLKLYNLPKEIKFCKECTISNQRPRISFDEKECAQLVITQK